jgi:hypothetical protein
MNILLAIGIQKLERRISGALISVKSNFGGTEASTRAIEDGATECTPMSGQPIGLAAMAGFQRKRHHGMMEDPVEHGLSQDGGTA